MFSDPSPRTRGAHIHKCHPNRRGSRSACCAPPTCWGRIRRGCLARLPGAGTATSRAPRRRAARPAARCPSARPAASVSHGSDGDRTPHEPAARRAPAPRGSWPRRRPGLQRRAATPAAAGHRRAGHLCAGHPMACREGAARMAGQGEGEAGRVSEDGGVIWRRACSAGTRTCRVLHLWQNNNCHVFSICGSDICCGGKR